METNTKEKFYTLHPSLKIEKITETENRAVIITRNNHGSLCVRFFNKKGKFKQLSCFYNFSAQPKKKVFVTEFTAEQEAEIEKATEVFFKTGKIEPTFLPKIERPLTHYRQEFVKLDQYGNIISAFHYKETENGILVPYPSK